MDNSVWYLTKSCSFDKSCSDVKAVVSGMHVCMQTDKSTQTGYLIMSINHSNVKGHLGASVVKQPRSNHEFDFVVDVYL